MDLFHCINQYIDYLVYIGVLNTKTRKIFETFFRKEKTSQKKSPSTPITTLLSLTLTKLIKSFTDSQLNETTTNIYNSFITNKRNASSKLILSIKTFQTIKQLKYFFYKWLQTTNKEQFHTLNTNTFSNKDILTYKTITSNKDINSDIVNPNINAKQNFMKRQETYKDKKIMNTKRKLFEKETVSNTLCPFTPTIYTKGYNFISNKSAFKRLYDDSSRRLKTYATKQNNYMKEIKNKSTWKASNTSRFYSNNKKGNNTLDHEKPGEKLYNDYKLLQDKKRSLQKEIDKERGMIFKPIINYEFCVNKKGGGSYIEGNGRKNNGSDIGNIGGSQVDYNVVENGYSNRRRDINNEYD
jgi:hypothetical protein